MINKQKRWAIGEENHAVTAWFSSHKKPCRKAARQEAQIITENSVNRL